MRFTTEPPPIKFSNGVWEQILYSQIRETLTKLHGLKYIALLSTGYNIVDCVCARELGVPVSNIPAYSTNAVAQLTFSLILEITNGAGLHSESVRAGEWSSCPDFCYWKTPLTELCGKTIGIVGFGQIGQAVALAIKNLLGLACDPVAGLVEVPCVKRIGFLAVHAMLAADMAMAYAVLPIPK